MPTGLEWMLPAAKAAYAHRADILSSTEWLLNYLRSKNKHIAITGCSGAGKTVLLDFLTCAAYQPGYLPPVESQTKEEGKVFSAKKKLRFVTFPGQDSPVRHEAIHQFINDKRTVDGIIHVVANGFIEVRGQGARDALSQDGINTALELRQRQLKFELESLADTCKLVRDSARRHRKPKWVLVAVAKVDLYYRELPQAQSYYSPDSIRSEFSSQLNELADRTGRDNFRWLAAPVCCWPENFVWQQDTVFSTMGTAERDHYVAKFLQTLQSLC